ncbi:MAG TPA: 3'-5' exonuclease [Candidatus Paceibacterota bacterium]|nr:3'-5' exonuclease [Candidatus Paceibacterota bacterium]HPT18173.1 3'-5' exonuclease [Candidatus Paceibacterota bacterium]
MRKHNLAFTDLETTGLNILKHEIIEIGCVITDYKLKVIEEFEIKIKPENIENADLVALKVNGYNDEDWKDAMSLKNALHIFSDKAKDCIMVGQNVAFDSWFLEYNFAKLNLKNTLHYHRLDTISIAWAKLHKKEEVNHFSLREMCKYFGIKNENPHRALSDAQATFELYKKLMNM